MITLLIFSVLTIGLYTAMVTIHSGIPCSISETYYRIENKKWFTFVMLFTAFTLLPCALEISTDDSRFFVFSKRSRYNYCGGITEFYKR